MWEVDEKPAGKPRGREAALGGRRLYDSDHPSRTSVSVLTVASIRCSDHRN